MTKDPDRPLVLFDGVCNFCDASVRFIIKRDPRRIFRFAALQSRPGQQELKHCGLPESDLSTIVLIEGPKIYTRSTAALRIARRLNGLWPLLYVLLLIPRPIRDALYGLIAKNRYRWFGKKEACSVPTPDIMERFLD